MYVGDVYVVMIEYCVYRVIWKVVSGFKKFVFEY